MSFPLPRIFAALFVLAFANFVQADDFRSLTIVGGTSSDLIRVHGNQFMLIRNFTQEDGTVRGVATVTTPPNGGPTINVLLAAALSQSQPPEVINSVVIAGPADVQFTCGASSMKHCFVSYKKDSN